MQQTTIEKVHAAIENAGAAGISTTGLRALFVGIPVQTIRTAASRMVSRGLVTKVSDGHWKIVKAVKPPKVEKMTSAKKSELIEAALATAGKAGMLTHELISVTGLSSKSLDNWWTRVGINEGRVRKPGKGSFCLVEKTVQEPVVAKTQVPRTKMPQEYRQLLPEIVKVAAEISLFEDRFLTPHQCYRRAETEVLTKLGKAELIRKPISMSSLKGVTEMFIKARVDLLDEVMKLPPAPVAPAPVAPAPVIQLSEYTDTELVGELLQRFAKTQQQIADLHARLIQATSSTGQEVVAPPAAKKPVSVVALTPLKILLVGLKGDQAENVRKHPPIMHRIKAGTLVVSDVPKGSAMVHTKRGTDHVIVFVTMVSHSVFDQSKTEGNLHYAKGLTTMKSQIIDLAFAWEKEHNLV